MSLTAATWGLAYIGLSIRGILSRPVYAFCRVLDDLLSKPQLLVVGEGSAQLHFPLEFDWGTGAGGGGNREFSRTARFSRTDRIFFGLLLAYVANCFAVHYLLADYPVESAKQLDLVWKACGLALLARLSIRDEKDLHAVFMTILLLSAYVGYAVVFTDAGRIEKGRLEGIDFPGASGSNGVAAILTMSFPIIGYFFVFNPLPWSRLTVVHDRTVDPGCGIAMQQPRCLPGRRDQRHGAGVFGPRSIAQTGGFCDGPWDRRIRVSGPQLGYLGTDVFDHGVGGGAGWVARGKNRVLESGVTDVAGLPAGFGRAFRFLQPARNAISTPGTDGP